MSKKSDCKKDIDELERAVEGERTCYSKQDAKDRSVDLAFAGGNFSSAVLLNG